MKFCLINKGCGCFFLGAASCGILIQVFTRPRSLFYDQKQEVPVVTNNHPAPALRVAPLPLAPAPAPRLQRPERPERPERLERLERTAVPAAMRSAASNVAKCELPPGGRWATVQLTGLTSFQMAVYASHDIVSSSVSFRHNWEQLDVRRFGKPGHACDIGGNIGFYTFALAKAGWNLTTFEAMPSNVALMKATLCANEELQERVDLHQVGLGDTPGRCSLMSDTINVGDGIVVCRTMQDPTKNIRAQFAFRTEFEATAMHALGVSTTRALSLIVSEEETVDRPWYDQSKKRPEVNEAFLVEVAPQLADAPPELKEMAIAQLRSQLRNPDRLQTEKCAICCRVAPSFLRVGHLELHGRRARRSGESESLQQLELIVKHALKREYSDVDPTGDLEQRILRMIQEFAKRLSKLMADWLRVGYCQGNFNSDNCLIAGRTMDYGPFGFIEKYDPLWNMWVGGGEHFAFMNQPKAAQKNFVSFVKALQPLLSPARQQEAQKEVDGFEELCQRICGEQCWRPKLGLTRWDSEVRDLFQDLEELMAESSIDYTIFWRQLATLPENTDALRPAFYSSLPVERDQRWTTWLQRWHRFSPDAALMRRTSPKFVPREWMLREAYEAAQKGDFSVVETLQKLFTSPFNEQSSDAARYFQKAPSKVENLGGVAFMS
eukprot:s171_g21.t1